jgi:hypothetical protein
MGIQNVVFAQRENNTPNIYSLIAHLQNYLGGIVHMSFGKSPRRNMKSLFINWSEGLNKRVKGQIRVGVCALMWTIWHL